MEETAKVVERGGIAVGIKGGDAPRPQVEGNLPAFSSSHSKSSIHPTSITFQYRNHGSVHQTSRRHRGSRRDHCRRYVTRKSFPIARLEAQSDRWTLF